MLSVSQGSLNFKGCFEIYVITLTTYLAEVEARTVQPISIAQDPVMP